MRRHLGSALRRRIEYCGLLVLVSALRLARRLVTSWLPVTIVALTLVWAVLTAMTAQASAVATADGWQWPLHGATPVVMRGFEPPPVPWAAGHRGVDLRARPGEGVYAAGTGVVGFAGLLAGRGVVAVHHADGLETTYEPLDVLVREGQRVQAGQLIGRVGAGHGDCGAGYVCLHWGLRRGATYLDPLQLVRAGPIRLLPVWRGGLPTPALAVAAQSDAPAHRGQPRSMAPATVGGAALAATGVASGIALAVRRRRRVAPP
jgi:murein DD-endopeptidase MepM/ murein hydrolase activator NlpD